MLFLLMLPPVDAQAMDDVLDRMEKPASPPESEKPTKKVSWYGFEILAVDTAILLGATAAGNHRFEGAWALLAGAPVVHLAHGQPGRSGASFGIHFLVAGTQTSSEQNFLIAGFAAALLDASLLAWKVHMPSVAVQPSATLVRGGGLLAVSLTLK